MDVSRFIIIDDQVINTDQIVRINFESKRSHYVAKEDKTVYERCVTMYFNDDGDEASINRIDFTVPHEMEALRWYFLNPEHGVALDIVQEKHIADLVAND